MTTDITTPELPAIKGAFQLRDEKLEAAQAAFSTAVDEANQELADAIRRAQTNKPMTQIANDAGVTRQTLHDIVRRYPAKA